MIRIRDIQKSFRTLVGWEEELGTELPKDLVSSDSGLTYQGAHGLLTLENVKSCLRKEHLADVESWGEDKAYSVNAVVEKSGKYFIARKANKGLDPESTDWNEDYNEDYGNGYWAEYTILGEYLRKAIDNGTSKVVNEFIATKSISGATKNLLEHKCLFDSVGRIADRIKNTHSLVGYEIQPLKGLGVTTQIHKIGLQMNGNAGTITLYLFHSSKSKPVAKYNVRLLRANNYQWFNVPESFMHYMSEDNNAGGAWYLCYHQDALPIDTEAVNISRDWSREPCKQCNKVNVEVWQSMTKYIRISPFKVSVPKGWQSNPTMFDVDNITYTPNYCYGMNIEISIGCDLTDFIISQRQLFASVLQKQVAYNVLQRIAFNPEVVVNRNQNNVSRQDFLFELEGNTYTRSGGIRFELKKAYDALDIDTSKMDSVCLSCKKVGVKYGVV